MSKSLHIDNEFVRILDLKGVDRIVFKDCHISTNISIAFDAHDCTFARGIVIQATEASFYRCFLTYTELVVPKATLRNTIVNRCVVHVPSIDLCNCTFIRTELRTDTCVEDGDTTFIPANCKVQMQA